jgi:hypothetical protein
MGQGMLYQIYGKPKAHTEAGAAEDVLNTYGMVRRIELLDGSKDDRSKFPQLEQDTIQAMRNREPIIVSAHGLGHWATFRHALVIAATFEMPELLVFLRDPSLPYSWHKLKFLDLVDVFKGAVLYSTVPGMRVYARKLVFTRAPRR